MTASPAVVTGLGVIAANGVGAEEYWEASLAGKNAIGEVSAFDSSSYPIRLAGEARDFTGADHLPSRLTKQTDRATQMSLVATEWALADAGVEPETFRDYDMGVVTSSAAGGYGFGQAELQKLWGQGSEFVSVYQSYAWFYAVNTGQVSIRHGMRGSNSVLVGEQAGGLDAVAHARRNIRNDAATLMVTGGTETTLCPWGWVAHVADSRVSRKSQAHEAYLPFDVEASGHVPGEGGAILITENADTWRARGGGNVYGELAGHASTFDPPPESGRGSTLDRAVLNALADAGVTPDEVDVVFADAAGLPELDAAEARALTKIFGPSGVPVTAPKTMFGRLYGGGGPLDLATALLSIRHDTIPPTTNTQVRAADCASLDLVLGEPRRSEVRTALVIARGYGGFNAATVVRDHPH
ncbi:ketosynthase chain-length factor [Streptomyces albidus (ex Kaewkla and Franco 2022)]|uniref:ketosynthase chain-length factor n=1 Tax=Streptomyces albidus (ex Kaewkla and Franco 2022) TaxID=722709 RepID=UPI0015EE4685|nr:ketosynthase chain-length factor [Streptomyces albidus (ex Kaewkla and Franco 2022)]